MPHIPSLVLPIGDKATSKADVKGSVLLSPAPEDQEDPSPDLSPVSTGSPRPGSSCYALIEAVANLAFWDDFEAEKIGSGFYADVYKIRHHGNGNILVVKISKSRNNRQNQHMMLQELELLNKLNHPNVVRYMGACVKDGHIHPLLEYISGGSLEDVLKDDKVLLSWQHKASLATDIARGIEYLHSKNVCHRDLKSENCLLRKLPENKLEAVVADFGLARVVELDEDDVSPPHESPRRMSLVGSPFWMAPEILRGEEYTKTVDVFSFGIILCEIMARISADPDDLPRTNKFGLDVDGFRKLCPPGCPENMLQLAADCCSMVPTERPSFTEIYHRLCHINHRLTTPTKPLVSIETKAHQTTATVTDDPTQDTPELTTSSGKTMKLTEHYANEDNTSDGSTTHESTSRIHNLALTKLTSTSRVLRALYAISAAAVLITLAVLNFWQSIYILIWVLVPLTLFTLYPVSMHKWWQQSHLSFKVSRILSTFGGRLSWNSSQTNRHVDFSDIGMSELKAEKSHQGQQHAPGCEDGEHGRVINAIDPKHDTFTIHGSDSDHPTIVLNDLSLDLNSADLANMPPNLRTRRRLSKTIYRSGSFSLHDSIDEHDDESRS